MIETASAGMPLVSVVIPAFNAENVISRAIESALAQDYSAVEVLVVDDCSTDRTIERVMRFAGKEVQLIRMPRNGGASAARNEGIRQASGRYIAFLDCDDEWLPGKLSAQVAAMETGPGYSLVVCDGEWIDPEGRVVDTALSDAPDRDDGEGWKVMLEHSFIATPCVLAPRDLLIELGGFDTSLMVAEDWDLWIRLGLLRPYGFVRDRLVRINVTPGSLMNREIYSARHHLLPMIRRHLDAQRHRLTAAEGRRAWAMQLDRVGSVECDAGSYWSGAWLLLRSMMLGNIAWSPVLKLATTFPAIRSLRERWSHACPKHN